MDLSATGGALIVTVLRLLHIVAGLIWVGAALMLSLYVERAASASGEEGRRFLRALYSTTGFPRLIPHSAAITTVAGLLLYGLLSYHEAMSSATGIILSVGALFGLLAFAHGYFAIWRYAGGMTEGRLDPLSQKTRRNGRVSLWLALASLVLMAGARYAGPIFA